ncbi:hypothetical protein D3C80_470750 [compost metagenome]
MLSAESCNAPSLNTLPSLFSVAAVSFSGPWLSTCPLLCNVCSTVAVSPFSPRVLPVLAQPCTPISMFCPCSLPALFNRSPCSANAPPASTRPATRFCRSFAVISANPLACISPLFSTSCAVSFMLFAARVPVLFNVGAFNVSVLSATSLPWLSTFSLKFSSTPEAPICPLLTRVVPFTVSRLPASSSPC